MSRLRYSRASRRAVRSAVTAAERLGHVRIGSEHLLLGLVEDGEVADLLRDDGVDLDQVRRAVVERVGARGGDPEGPDPEDLRRVGIDLDEVRNRATPPQPVVNGSRRRRRRVRHLPMTREARVALEAAMPVASDLRSRRVEPRHVLVGLATARPARSRALLQDLGVDAMTLRARLQRGP